MNENTTNNDVVEKEAEMEKVAAENTIERIKKILDEDGMVLRARLDGYPFQLVPVIDVIRKKENVKTEATA